MRGTGRFLVSASRSRIEPAGTRLAKDRETKPRKLAVLIFNLGGPDSPEAVRPFLLNLFNDPAILRLPNPLRWAEYDLLAL